MNQGSPNQPQVRCVNRGDPDYPEPLLKLARPPQKLYWAGEQWPPSTPGVAIVGSRAASPYGLEIAETLASDLARIGFTVISGMARGVDAAAHIGALAGGGTTVAVLARAPESPYPRELAGLHVRILAAGSVCAEYSRSTPPLRGLFVRRNRIVAALAQAVVVVEATARSGALATAAWGRRLGKLVAVVPGDVTREQSQGTLRLLRDGARAIGCAGDLAKDLTEEQTSTNLTSASVARRGVTPVALLAEFSGVPMTAATLASQLDLPLDSVVAQLVSLEVSGAVSRDECGRYLRSDLKGEI